mmetsp:Transcript_51112/g.94595  ORF Transcript_51112/g.94595 Transcript_51112/m.94595 type:complete len:511 (-) Transcript_51112:304-1836(-)
MSPHIEVSDENRATATTGSCSWKQDLSALKDLVKLVVPILGGQAAGTLSDRWTLAFVGHWDFEVRAHYDAAGIGKMYSNITGLSLGTASLIGLSTFLSQVYGAGLSEQLSSVYFRRSCFLLCFVYMVTCLAAVSSEHVLLWMSMPEDVSRCSAVFVKVQVAGLPFWWTSSAMRIAMNSMRMTLSPLLAQSIAAAAQIVMCIIFMHPKLLGLGYIGCALARTLGGLVSLAVLIVCVKVQKVEHLIWRLPSNPERIVEWQAIRTYCAVALPSAAVVWSEWWAFEILTLLVGWTPAADRDIVLAAHGTMYNIIVVVYMVWTAASVAMSTLVGNYIGAHRNFALPSLFRAAFVFSMSSAVLTSIGYELSKAWLARAFTEDKAVQQSLVANSLGLVLSVPVYSQFMTFSGAMRGANRQRPAILGATVGYWIIGLPAGGLMGCVLHWPTPLTGIWLGNALALLIASVWVCYTAFLKTDWQNIKRLSACDAPRAPLLQNQQALQDDARQDDAESGQS